LLLVVICKIVRSSIILLLPLLTRGGHCHIVLSMFMHLIFVFTCFLVLVVENIGTMSECLNIFCFAQDVNIFDSHDVDLYNKYNPKS
jgi:hypothetical protein